MDEFGAVRVRDERYSFGGSSFILPLKGVLLAYFGFLFPGAVGEGAFGRNVFFFFFFFFFSLFMRIYRILSNPFLLFVCLSLFNWS